jgi:hypothetical protein
MTGEARALVTLVMQREEKLRGALEGLQQRQQSCEAEKTRLQGLLDRLAALQSQITPKPVGRPSKWRGAIGCDTVLFVENGRRLGGSIIGGLRALREHPEWAKWWAGRSEEELQVRYQEALKHWQPLFQELKKIECAIAENHIDNSPPPDVERLVSEG